jgi:hypothetical protein
VSNFASSAEALATSTTAINGNYWVFVDGRYVVCELRIVGVTLRQLRWIVRDGEREHLGAPFFPLKDLVELQKIARLALGDFS